MMFKLKSDSFCSTGLVLVNHGRYISSTLYCLVEAESLQQLEVNTLENSYFEI